MFWNPTTQITETESSLARFLEFLLFVDQMKITYIVIEIMAGDHWKLTRTLKGLTRLKSESEKDPTGTCIDALERPTYENFVIMICRLSYILLSFTLNVALQYLLDYQPWLRLFCQLFTLEIKYFHQWDYISLFWSLHIDHHKD